MKIYQKIFIYFFMILLGIFLFLGLHSLFNIVEQNNKARNQEQNILVELKYQFKLIYENLSNINVLKNQFIDLYGGIQKLFGNKCIHDASEGKDVILLNDGSLSFALSKYDTSNITDKIKILNDDLSQHDIPFLYVQLPFKISKYETQLPYDIDDYSNQNTDNLMEKLEENDIDIMDMRDSFYNDHLKSSEIFFKTDHHWKPEGALIGAKYITTYLNENYNFDFDIEKLDLKNYNKNTYYKWFLGSQGKRVGKYYNGIDNINIFTPKFETDYVFEAPTYNIVKKGTFEKTLLNYDNINIKDLYDKNAYVTYIGADYDLNIIHNNMVQNNNKILLIRDSFSCTLVPFLSTIVQELHTIDLRYYKDKTLQEYIKEIQPDIVIFALNPSMYQSSTILEKFEVE